MRLHHHPKAARMSKNFGPPMTLANMRQNGVRAVIASCEACGHAADVNVDSLAETIAVPKVGGRLRCSYCGGKQINTRPAWHTGRDAWGGASPGVFVQERGY
jgi:ABC-type hemin transport system substrate-binding protein